MKAITVDTQARQITIDHYVDKAIGLIEVNASSGKAVTELSFPKEFAGAIRDEIEKRLTESGTKYDFMIMDRRPNPYTGRMEQFSGITIGEDRHYKIKVL